MVDSIDILLRSLLDMSKSKSSIENQIKELSKQIQETIVVKLQLDPKDIQILTKQVDEVKQNIKRKTVTKGSQFINMDVEHQAFKDITSRISEIRRNVDELAKVDIVTDKNNNLKSATLSYYNKELGQTVTETMGWSVAQKKINDELVSVKTFATTGFKYSDNMSKARQETEKLAQSLKDLNLYQQKMLGGNGFSGELDIFASKNKGRYDVDALKNLRTEVQGLNKDTPDLQNKIKRLNIEFGSLKQSAMQSSNVLTNALVNAGKFLRFYLVGGTLVGFVNVFKDSIRYIKELDNSLNEIRIVTGYTQAQVNKLADSYNDLAKQMHVTTAEIVKQSAELYRQGLTDAQVETRMRAIIQYAKISSISVAQSNEIITATANATKESVDKIIDIFALLGDITASGADEIGEALQKVASAAENSNVTLEKSASWIATISSITRESASTIGRSLNSMIARYEQIRSSGFNSEDATKLNDVVEALNKIGIKATDAAGQLLPITEVVDKLGAKWNTLSKNEQSYIATTLAGTYQRNRLLTLLNNYTDSMKNYQAALNAAGTAEQKYNIYQESSQAILDKLKATTEEFWQNSVSSETIKNTIELLTRLVDTFGNLHTVLIYVGTAFAMWKGSDIISFISKFTLSTNGLTNEITKYGQKILTARLETQNLAKADKEAQIASLGFGGSLKEIFKANWIGWLMLGISAITTFSDMANQKSEELKQKIAENAQKAKEESDSILELLSSYEKLNSVQNKDEETRQQIKIIQDQLIKNLGLEKENIDLLNDTRGESIKKIRDESLAKLKASEYSLIAAKNEAEANAKALNKSRYLYTNKADSPTNAKVYSALNGTEGLNVMYDKVNGQYGYSFNKSIDTVQEKSEVLKNALDKLVESGLTDNKVFELLSEKYTDLSSAADTLNAATSSYNSNQVQQIILTQEISGSIPKTIDEFKSWKKELMDNNNKSKEFNFLLGNTIDQYFPQFTGQLQNSSEATDDYSTSLNNLNNSISTAQQSVSDFKSKVSDLTSVYNTLTNGEQVSSDTILDLIQKYPAYTTALANINKNKEQGITLTKNLYNVEITALLNTLKAERQKLALAYEELSVEKQKLQLQQHQLNLLIKRQTSAGNYKLVNQLKEELESVKQQMQDIGDPYARLYEMDQLIDYVKSLDISDWSGKVKKENNDIVNSEQAKLDAIKDIESRLVDIYKKGIEEEIDAEQKRHDKRVKDLQDELSQYKKNIDEQLNLLDKQENESNYQEDLATKTKDLAKLQQERNRKSLDDTFDLSDLDEQISAKQKEIADTIHEHNIELRKDELQNQLETKEEEINGKISQIDQEFEDYKVAQNKKLEQDQIYINARKLLYTDSISELQSKLVNFENEFGDGMSASGDSIKKNIIDNLNTVKGLLSSMGWLSLPAIANVLQGNITAAGGNPTGFASGGYTGDWSGDSGKLAVLHKKEAILDADTVSSIEKGDYAQRLLSKIIMPTINTPRVANMSNNDSISFGDISIQLGNMPTSGDGYKTGVKIAEGFTDKINETFKRYGVKRDVPSLVRG